MVDNNPGNTDTTALESKESATQRKNQAEQELKILKPDQILCRLPTTLAQL